MIIVHILDEMAVFKMTTSLRDLILPSGRVVSCMDINCVVFNSSLYKICTFEEIRNRINIYIYKEIYKIMLDN